MSTWDIQEAASGEAALRLIDTKEFDIIFMDQYMASVEKKLLGTETVHAMRSKGVRSRICGLSANDVEEGFLSNGADAFMFKPFPCKKEQLERELHHLLHISRHSQHAGMTTSYNVSDDVSTRRPEGLDGSRENSDNTANMVVNA
jgi:CheY-like chemotaxis protein